MKKRLKTNQVIFIFGVIIVLILTSYIIYQFYFEFGSRQLHFKWVDSTSLSKEKIGEYHLFQSIKTITPQPIPENNNDLYDYYTVGSGVEIATKKHDDKVIRIIINKDAKELKTAKGIGIGDSKKEVISLYGTSFYERIEQGLYIIGYVDKNLHQTLEFWFFDDKVNMIRLDIDEMN